METRRFGIGKVFLFQSNELPDYDGCAHVHLRQSDAGDMFAERRQLGSHDDSRHLLP